MHMAVIEGLYLIVGPLSVFEKSLFNIDKMIHLAYNYTSFP